MIIDTHCHYNLDQLYGPEGKDWQKHWQTAQEHDVTHSIVVGVNIQTSTRAIAVARQGKNLRASVGLHPHAIEEYPEEITPDLLTTWITHLDKLVENAKNTHEVVGIGETGLDYFRLDLTNPDHKKIADLQKELFIQHIKLADKHLLPLLIHVRDTTTAAYDHTLQLLKEHKRSNLSFVLHCVSGPLSYVKAALDLGGYIGLAGNVTYKNATQIHDIARTTTHDRILVETDAPYLPPLPHRGKTCEPWMIQLTAEHLADEFNISLERMYTNTLQVFPSLSTK